MSIAQERRSRLDFLKEPNEVVADEFEKNIVVSSSRKELIDSWDFAKSIEYDHVGLTKLAYLAHPVRVANLYKDLVSQNDVYGIQLAILHNVLEVGAMDNRAIASAIGDRLFSDISILTVDRSRQWNPEYKDAYYSKIKSSDIKVAQIKVLDKLDNLFMLSLNKSDEIRERYLLEIERWVIPMAESVIPDIAEYMRELVAFNREVKYSTE